MRLAATIDARTFYVSPRPLNWAKATTSFNPTPRKGSLSLDAYKAELDTTLEYRGSTAIFM